MNYTTKALHPRLTVSRMRIMLALLLIWFVALAARAVYLQGMNNDFLREKGDARYSRVIEISAHRGMISDRNGEPLAISTPVESIWASPADVSIVQEQVNKLASLLEMNTRDIQQRLKNTEREFVYLKRQVPPEIAERVAALEIPGIFLQREYRRYYPAGEVTAHILGFTDIDDNGQEGVELAHQDWLSGKPGSRRVIKDRLGHIVEDVESIRSPRPGRDLELSIDRKIQYLAYRELKHAVEINKAKAGGIVVMDVKTGEVLAIANLPSYNPNNRIRVGDPRARNRAVTDIFEPGSTLKPFTVAAALEAGIVRSDTVFETEPGYMTIGSATIRDAHPLGKVTVAEVIQKSSNIGAAKIAFAIPREKLWGMLNKVGFGASTQAGFPGEATGKLRPFNSWRPIEQATMAFGHGISVSLLQLTRAYSIFATNGELKPIVFIKNEATAASRQVISPRTALAMRDMLEMAVQPGGTAPRAQISGYRVAGKTGTAHKLQGRGYAPDRYVSSFVGFAPASNPRLVVAVMIDEPSAGQYYGGAVAAPVFSQVMGGALRVLSVLPDAPTDNHLLIPTEAPLIKEEV